MSEVTRDPEAVATDLAGKLSARTRHVCVLLGAGAARSAGLPGLGGLQDAVKESSRLTKTQQQQVAELFKTKNLEEVLSYLRRLVAILGDGQSLGGFDGASAKELQTAITGAIIPALDHKAADPEPFCDFATWVSGAYYRLPVEIFTINYDLLLEAGFEELAVPYFDGFVGTIGGRFRPELVDTIDPTEQAQALPSNFVRLWKLHGSVNWEELPDGTRHRIVRRGVPATDGATAAIYPSDEKYDQSRRVPFVVLMDRFRRALAVPETVTLVAGYSFGDQHLNEMLFDAARAHPRSETVVSASTTSLRSSATWQPPLATSPFSERPKQSSVVNDSSGFGQRTCPACGKAVPSSWATLGTWRDSWRRRHGSAMSERDPRAIGRVRHVRGATVTVELDESLAGVTPLWEGRLHPIGQVGSLVEIPQGPVKLLASVTLVGIAELSGVLEPSAAVQVGDRWLQVQLLGEVDGLGRFQRGVSTYPGLDDPVQFTTPAGLRAIFPPPGADHVRLGALASAPDVAVALAAQPLVMRHGAIVGSTGSGKTSAVASLLQSFVRDGWTSANVVVVDPHGEYAKALEATATVRSVLGTGNSMLRVPFWALPAGDILRAFCGREESATLQNRFGELATSARRNFVSSAAWLKLEPASVSADTPVPFDLNEVWYRLDYDNNATYSQANGKGDAEVDEEGDAASLKPTRFKPYAMGSTAPFKGPMFGMYGTAPDRLRLRLADPRFRFFLEPKGDPAGEDPLPGVIVDWLGNERPLSVLDFSGVPSEATDLAVGLILQMLFELSVRSRTKGIGRPRPVLVVLEEAHRYLGDSATTRVAKESANRIAREGRKYGIGLLLVTQRPSELPDTALSQVGTIVALRLTNGTDQSTVKAALPDAVAGLAEALPALRTGEAIVAGEAVTLPCRVQITRPNPRPEADDPSLDSWRMPPAENDVRDAIARWRGSTAEGEA